MNDQHLITFYNAYLEQRQVNQTAMNTKTQITGKEVLNITPGKWIISTDWETETTRIETDKGRYVAQIDDIESESSKSDAKAICTAVNETYGKGFRPEAMEGLYKALEEITNMALRWSEKGLTPTIHKAQTALNNAKL